MAEGHKNKQPQRSGMATLRFDLPSPAERTASLFSIPSPLSSPSEKTTPGQNTKQPERELKCQNMNLRASEVASLPLPVFRLMLIWAHWGCTGERMRWQQLMLLQENTSFSTEHRGCTGKSLLSLQAACATILDGAAPLKQLELLGAAQFPFPEPRIPTQESALSSQMSI